MTSKKVERFMVARYRRREDAATEPHLATEYGGAGQFAFPVHEPENDRMTLDEINDLSAAERRLLDYVAVLGPEPVPRGWTAELQSREKGILPQVTGLRLAAESDPVEVLLERSVLRSSDEGLTVSTEIAEQLIASIHERPAYRATLWNGITVLALARGKLLLRGQGNLRERNEAIRCVVLARRLAAEERKLAALDLASQICHPLLVGELYSEAISLLEELLDGVEEANFNRRHIVALCRLADAYLSSKNALKSYAIREKALQLSIRLNGPQHRETAYVHAGVAQAAALLKQAGPALSAAWQSITIYRQHVPEGHHLLAYPYEALALAQFANQKGEEARESMQRAIDIRKASNVASKQPLASDCLFVAGTYLKGMKWAEAERWCDEALEFRLQQLDEDAAGMEPYYSAAASVARGLKKHERAKSLTEKVIALRLRKLPPTDEKVVQAKVLLSGTLVQMKLESEAIKLTQECVDALEKQSEPSPLVLKAMYERMMFLHQKNKRFQEAFQYVQRHLAVMEKITQNDPGRMATLYVAAMSRALPAKQFVFSREMAAKARPLLESMDPPNVDGLAILEMKERDQEAMEQVHGILESRRKAWEVFAAEKKNQRASAVGDYSLQLPDELATGAEAPG